MKLESLHELYLEELKDIYSAENQLLKALPKMAAAASAASLREAFEEHLQVTQEQVARLDKIFGALNQTPGGKKCAAMEGLIKEADELLAKEGADPEVLDAALIAAAQKVEHYEIASYGTVRTYAKLLGEDDAAELLQETLNEEGETDEKLTVLAEEQINVQAARHE